jgi:hypothetical protein
LASQGLFDPATLTLDEMRAICAAALMRVPDHRQQDIVQSRRFRRINNANVETNTLRCVGLCPA